MNKTMAELSYAQVNALLKFEPSTGALVWKARHRSMFGSDRACNAWNARHSGKQAFLIDADGYRAGYIFKRRYFAHRICWLLETGSWPSGEIDHRDQNRSNNSIKNLRDVPRGVNMKNKKKQVNNTSGQTGVSWLPARRKWSAYLNDNGKRKHLGLFQTKEEAISVRLCAAAVSGYSPIHGVSL